MKIHSEPSNSSKNVQPEGHMNHQYRQHRTEIIKWEIQFRTPSSGNMTMGIIVQSCNLTYIKTWTRVSNNVSSLGGSHSRRDRQEHTLVGNSTSGAGFPLNLGH